MKTLFITSEVDQARFLLTNYQPEIDYRPQRWRRPIQQVRDRMFLPVAHIVVTLFMITIGRVQANPAPIENLSVCGYYV